MKIWKFLVAKWKKTWAWLRGRRPHYHEILYVSSASEVSTLKPHQIAIVNDQGALKWALVPCPCKCGELIHACLMRSRNPHWELSLEPDGYPTLAPSLWRSTGCGSHFFIRQGNVLWA